MPLLIDWLIKKYPTAKRTTLKRMVEDGRVTVNGQVARKLKEEIAEGAVVAVSNVERPQASAHPLKILHEDADVLVVLKPSGLLTSTTATEPRPTAIAILRRYLAESDPRARAGVIHRLDRDASGLLVFSKNNEAYEALKHQFFHHTVDRIYTLVVHGTPRQAKGRVDARLVEFPDGSVHVTRNPDKGERAVTDFEVIKRLGNCSLVRVTLRTGRKHQIRAHMVHLGCPIVGDSVYATEGEGKKAKSRPEASRLLLAATALAFDHPRTGKRMSFEVEPPPQLQAFVDARSKPKG